MSLFQCVIPKSILFKHMCVEGVLWFTYPPFTFPLQYIQLKTPHYSHDFISFLDNFGFVVWMPNDTFFFTFFKFSGFIRTHQSSSYYRMVSLNT